MKQFIFADGINLRDILIAAAGAQFVVDAARVAVTDSSNQMIIREAVGYGSVNALQVFRAFKKIRVNSVVGIQ